MTAPVSLDSLVAHVRDQFRIRNSVPNGWALKWDESRYFDAITAAANPYPTVNTATSTTSFATRTASSASIADQAIPGVSDRSQSSSLRPFCIYWTQREFPFESRRKKWPRCFPVCREKVTERISLASSKRRFL